MPEGDTRVSGFRIQDVIVVPSWLGLLLVFVVTCAVALFCASIWIAADVRSEIRQLRAEHAAQAEDARGKADAWKSWTLALYTQLEARGWNPPPLPVEQTNDEPRP